MLRTRLALFLLLPLALVAMGFAMVMTARTQAHAAADAASRSDAGNRLLLAMVDQETGLRGYLLTSREEFLAPFYSGDRDGTIAERDVRAEADGDQATLALLTQFSGLKLAWRIRAQTQIADRRGGERPRGTIAAALGRKRLMDGLRTVAAHLKTRLDARRAADLDAAGRRAAIEVVALTLLLGILAVALLTRERHQRRAVYRRELAYRQAQREFTGVIQVVHSEPEADALLKRHLELAVPGAHATVLKRNNSDNRLQASTEVPAGSALARRLDGAEPQSCVAVRLGRRHEELADDPQLLTCAVCGDAPGRSVCEPLLVGGQVIGSVLVERADLDDEGDRHLVDSVAQAAPVLANLRNLAVAERQASTDALTGLPNRRAVQDAVARMAARAARDDRPLAAIALDLDHFKDINDRFGHDMGDTVLAHVGTLLSGTVRAGDLVGRIGGEEFVVLAPGTDVAGALVLAESLRAALAGEAVPGLDRDVTGSFGVAVLPDHAATAESLLRLADRALYAAKGAGRDRVELVAAAATDAAPSPAPAA
jgi:diguanylate cyclase (GGDEF)-like protein